jgi:hypothetical protein
MTCDGVSHGPRGQQNKQQNVMIGRREQCDMGAFMVMTTTGRRRWWRRTMAITTATATATATAMTKRVKTTKGVTRIIQQ